MEPTPPREGPITVLTTLTARPGKESDLRGLLCSLLGTTRKETGCLNYDLHEAPDNPAKFLLHGRWQAQSHLDAHFKMPHVMLALRHMDDLCVEPVRLEFWRPIG